MIRRTLYVVILSFAFVLALSSTAVGQDQACDAFPNQAAAQQALREDPTDPEGLDGPPGRITSPDPQYARKKGAATD